MEQYLLMDKSVLCFYYAIFDKHFIYRQVQVKHLQLLEEQKNIQTEVLFQDLFHTCLDNTRRYVPYFHLLHNYF